MAPQEPAGLPRRFVNAYEAGGAIVTFRRDEDGRLLRGTVPAEHSFFIRKADASTELMRELRASKSVRGVSETVGHVRVRCRDDFVRRRLVGRDGFFARQGVEVFEGDVRPVRRWITDHGIQIQRPKRCFIDFECDSRVSFANKDRARILVWCIVDGETGEAWTGVLDVETDAAERALLEAFWARVDQYDQVLAWNGDRYDFPVLEARTHHHRLRIELSRWLWLDQLEHVRRMNMSASESGDEKQSMALGNFAQAVLGYGKHDVDAAKAYEAWVEGGASRERLRSYCEQDGKLLFAIEQKTGLVELLQTVAETCFVFPNTAGTRPTTQVEGFMLHLGAKRDVRFATRHFKEEREDEEGQFKGAHVLEPTCEGIVRNVHVADFSRLYPSIIISWNMSPETWARDVVLKESATARPTYLRHLPVKSYPIPERHCAAPITDRVFSLERQGVLPEALASMIQLRKEWERRKAEQPPQTPAWKEADRRANAYKITANSFFGVIGCDFSRFYVREIAEAITQAGVWLIKKTIEAAANEGMDPIYGDTDSIFVKGATREGFADFVRRCNTELYPGLLRELQCEENAISLAYEKQFERIVFTVKKRYVARLLHYKGKDTTADSKHEIKGLEYKRGDSARLARQMQFEVVQLLLTEQCEDPDRFAELVARWVDRVREEAFALADIMIAKRLSKPLGEYVQKTKKDGQPSAMLTHVAIGHMLAERGHDVGAGVRIEYVVTDGEKAPIVAIPAEDFAGDFDRFYLWENVIFPPTLRLLEAAFPRDVMRWQAFARLRPVVPRLSKVERVQAKQEAAGQMSLLRLVVD